MPDIRKLLHTLAAQEEAFRQTRFVAPCVRGGKVRAKVAGIVQTFAPQPADFEGWGLFQARDAQTAEALEEASLPLVAEYLKRLPRLRLRLAYALQGQTWLAYPVNESDMRQRAGTAKPVPVFLVTEGAAFETVTARGDGGAWWFEESDRRADPRIAEQLKAALRAVTPPEEVRFKGVTPEMRAAYGLAAQQEAAFFAQALQQRDRERLENALRAAGGRMQDYQDRGDYWLVEWYTRDGAHHHSAISRRDLTVISSGICLSGRDNDFDLQSLVGVMERREDDW